MLFDLFLFRFWVSVFKAKHKKRQANSICKQFLMAFTGILFEMPCKSISNTLISSQTLLEKSFINW